MLERHLELRGDYDEVHSQLVILDAERDIYVFFDGLLCMSAIWNPEEVAKSREWRRQIQQVNKKITKEAEQLARTC